MSVHDRPMRIRAPRSIYVVEYNDPQGRVQVEAIFATRVAANARAKAERKVDRREGIDTGIRVVRYVAAEPSSGGEK